MVVIHSLSQPETSPLLRFGINVCVWCILSCGPAGQSSRKRALGFLGTVAIERARVMVQPAWLLLW